MQLSLIRRGGFAGLRPPAFVVDLASLPPATAGNFQQLLSAAKSDLGALGSQAPQPDRFMYVLTVSGPDGRCEEFAFDEGVASPAVMALVAAIQAAVRN